MYIQWQRGEYKVLSSIPRQGWNVPERPIFTSSMFECPCGKCNMQKISMNLLSMLMQVRNKSGCDIIITSGYRCDWYQKHLKKMGYKTSVGPSTHQTGHAADFTTKVGFKRLKAAADEVFRSLGIGKDWLHGDTRNDKKRRWGY